MVIFHDHSDIKSSAPPLRQCRSFYSSYFLWGNYFLSLRLTLLVCSHFRSIIPIKFFSFSVLLSRRSKNWPPSNTYEWIWPCTFFFFFLAVYQSVLVVSLKEWEKKKMRDPEMRGTHSKHQSLLVCLHLLWAPVLSWTSGQDMRLLMYIIFVYMLFFSLSEKE